jgi:hypothetical protein
MAGSYKPIMNLWVPEEGQEFFDQPSNCQLFKKDVEYSIS